MCTGFGRRRLRIAAGVALTVALQGGVAARTADDHLVRVFAFDAARPFAIAIGAGRVRVTGAATQRDVRVTIVRSAASVAALAAAPPRIDDAPSGVTIDLVPAADAPEPWRTDVSIEAPPGLRLDAVRIADGTLELRGLTGAVRAVVDRGAITADEIGGVMRLETTIGPVTVTRANLDPGGMLRLRTFNGDVRLAFTSPLEDARVMALALNGTITSSLPLTTRTGWGPRWGETSIGRADRVVSLDVVTGAIRLEATAAR